jgi:hypothetical protein
LVYPNIYRFFRLDLRGREALRRVRLTFDDDFRVSILYGLAKSALHFYLRYAIKKITIICSVGKNLNL